MADTADPIAAKRLPIDADLLCGHCGHNLRGLPSDRCPECGALFDRGRLYSGLVPWEQRRRLGFIRSYARTVRNVSFRSGAAAPDDVSLAGARSFRRWNLALLFVTLAGPIAYWRHEQGPGMRAPGSFWPFFEEHREPLWREAAANGWMFGIALASLLVWLFVTAGLPGWFIPKRLAERQRVAARAWALYACAPLAWVTPLAIALVLLVCLGRSYYWEGTAVYYIGVAVSLTVAILIVFTPIVWLAVAALLVGRMTGSRWRGAAVVVLVPPLGVVLAGVIFLSVTFLLNYVALLFYTLRG